LEKDRQRQEKRRANAFVKKKLLCDQEIINSENRMREKETYKEREREICKDFKSERHLKRDLYIVRETGTCKERERDV